MEPTPAAVRPKRPSLHFFSAILAAILAVAPLGGCRHDKPIVPIPTPTAPADKPTAAPPPSSDAPSKPGQPSRPANTGRRVTVDDWQYRPEQTVDSMRMPSAVVGGGVAVMRQSVAAPAPAMMAESVLGFSTGGAKDVGNFRENLRNGYLPIPTDIGYEGLFYDYSFDTGASRPCRKLFCPSYIAAISPDPFSASRDLYLTVGLNSGLNAATFHRKHLNLVLVLDISGSMSSPFDRYYYDRFGRRTATPTEEKGQPKIRLATEAMIGLISHLSDADRLGIVLFSDSAYVAKPLRSVAELDPEKLAAHLRQLRATNGTNLEAGMNQATRLLQPYDDLDREQYENRIIFLTDAQPNIGETRESGLAGLARANAARQDYTTFVGIGVDFNTALVSEISRIRGANYYSVHSASEFAKRLDDEFEFMVTPLVFDVSLVLETSGYDILKVYGSPEANEATGEIMRVHTLFPSRVERGETRGGVILLKLRRHGSDGRLTLRASWEDGSGHRDRETATIVIPTVGGIYPTTGIRKAILLSRYADVLIDWVTDERRQPKSGVKIVPIISEQNGIPCPQPHLGQWERQSMRLAVSPAYRPILASFRKHFREEAKAIGDTALGRELDVLDHLVSSNVRGE